MTESGDEQLRTIDEILAVLQSPARAGELDGEEEMVEAMAAVVITAHDEEPAPMHSRSRPLKLGVLAGAAMLSLAGVAAATGVLPDRKTTPPTAPTIVVAPTASAVTMPQDSTTTTVAEAATTATVPATVADTSTTDASVAAAAAAAPTVSAPPCPPDVLNHGDYVSRVARDTPPGPDHGKIVSAAANSDCGKPSAPPASTPAAPAPAGHGRSDHAPTGQAHSNGNNGGGHGHGHG
jgi:hypothetical protein